MDNKKGPLNFLVISRLVKFISIMDIIYFRDYCLSKSGTTEDTPFDKDTLCFRVGGKIFAITDMLHFESINLKCDPDIAIELREKYSGIQPGFHMNKKHWNTVSCDGSVSDSLILKLADDSYDLIFYSLPKKVQEDLNNK